jgi:hypothetical protein
MHGEIMKRYVIGTLFLLIYIITVTAMEHPSGTAIFNGAFGIGTFSAGEHEGGSKVL